MTRAEKQVGWIPPWIWLSLILVGVFAIFLRRTSIIACSTCDACVGLERRNKTVTDAVTLGATVGVVGAAVGFFNDALLVAAAFAALAIGSMVLATRAFRAGPRLSVVRIDGATITVRGLHSSVAPSADTPSD